MDELSIQDLVLNAIILSNQSREDSQQIPISGHIGLFGSEGNIDSMGLVLLLIDIEDMLHEKGFNVSLSDERAMSRARSPFKDVPTLVTHISGLLEARK